MSSATSEQPQAEAGAAAKIVPRPHPVAQPHGPIQEIFPNVYFVQGSCAVEKPVPMTFSRNMSIVRNSEDNNKLTLFNSMRLDDAGLAELDKLGTVTHIVRLSSFHGMDDPFYKERYPNATVWSPAENAPYFAGLAAPKPNEPLPTPYFAADTFLSAETAKDLPFFPQASAILIPSANRLPEAAILLPQPDEKGTILVTGDSLQNYGAWGDDYFNFFTKVMMWVMGFLKPHNVGPAWYEQAKPDKEVLTGLLDTKFQHVLPGHGDVCLQDAYQKYEPAIRRLK